MERKGSWCCRTGCCHAQGQHFKELLGEGLRGSWESDQGGQWKEHLRGGRVLGQRLLINPATVKVFHQILNMYSCIIMTKIKAEQKQKWKHHGETKTERGQQSWIFPGQPRIPEKGIRALGSWGKGIRTPSTHVFWGLDSTSLRTPQLEECEISPWNRFPF